MVAGVRKIIVALIVMGVTASRAVLPTVLGLGRMDDEVTVASSPDLSLGAHSHQPVQRIPGAPVCSKE